LSIEKTANVTISREFFDDLLRYFSYYNNNFYDLISSCQSGVWSFELSELVYEYANLEFSGAYSDELQKPTNKEMYQLNERIQKHIAEKLLAVGNREKYRQGQFAKGNFRKKK